MKRRNMKKRHLITMVAALLLAVTMTPFASMADEAETPENLREILEEGLDISDLGEDFVEEIVSIDYVGPEALIVSYDGEPDVEKTVTWSLDGLTADEFRYLPGTHSSDDFGSARPAGSGTSGSMTVTENGNYTVFAKVGTFILARTVTVSCIDRNAPDIYIGCISGNDDGTVNIQYTVRDYYDGEAEVRILEGGHGSGDFGSARLVSGGTISGLAPGEYTLFAKDSAGNCSTYTLTAGEEHSAEKIDEAESETFHEESFSMYGSTTVTARVLSAKVTVRKVDSSTGKDIPDAKLRVSDKETGGVFDEWISNGDPHVVTNLIPGRTYILSEPCYPKGYRRAADIEFTVQDGDDITLVMEDEPDRPLGGDDPPETTAPPATTAPAKETPGSSYIIYQAPKTEPETPAPETSPAPETQAPVKMKGNTEKIGLISIEKLPQTGGNNGLIGAALALTAAGGLGTYVTGKKKKKEDGDRTGGTDKKE